MSRTTRNRQSARKLRSSQPNRYIGKHEQKFNPRATPFSDFIQEHGAALVTASLREAAEDEAAYALGGEPGMSVALRNSAALSDEQRTARHLAALPEEGSKPETETTNAARDKASSTSSRSFLLRSSALIASGTMVSRMLGFVKNFLLGMVFGGSQTIAADAFSAANVLPNSIWILVGSGTLNAILVPAVVRAMKHKDRGSDYISRLLTLVMTFTIGVTLISTLLVPVLLPIANGALPAEKYALALSIGYWLMPQILFSAVYVLCGHVLNAHNNFGVYSWAPALNNVVAILGSIGFLLLYGTQTGQTAWTGPMVFQLALITLGGSAAQGLLVLIWLRKLNLHLRPKWGFRGMGLMKLGKIGGWTTAMLALGQLGVFATRWATANASKTSEALLRAGNEAYVHYPAISAIDNSYLAFMLPQSIVAVSLVTAVFPSLSRAAAEENHREVSRQYIQMSRMLAIPMVLFTVIFIVLSAPIMWVIVGRSSQEGAVALGYVLSAYMVGLVPFATTYLMKRLFYAYEDARTPFLMQIPISILPVLGCAPILAFVDARWATATAALVSSLGTAGGWIFGAWMMKRRFIKLGSPMDLTSSATTYGKLLVSAAVSGLIGFGMVRLTWSFMWHSRPVAVLVGLFIGAVMTAIYLGVTYLLKVDELHNMISTFTNRFGRKRRRA